MRKRTIKNVADTVFWYVLYFLPVIVYMCYLTSIRFNIGVTAEEPTEIVAVMEEPMVVDSTIPLEYNFEAFVDRVGFGFVSDNVVVDGLMDIFGENGIMPFFTTKTPFIILGWFVGVFLLHLSIDFLLFIPRIAHKWLKKCTEDD